MKHGFTSLNHVCCRQVNFEPPRVSLPGGIHLAVGPTSSVVLTTTYLDDQVRLGRGSRGSSFVFTRGGASNHAGDACPYPVTHASPGAIQ